jgi:hypothetical protein
MYDLIGDIHGHAAELRALLRLMGYRKDRHGYRHPSRKVIFAGDFIDRGPNQQGVLEIVLPMVEQGHALAVMGNHEFNALGYHTRHPATGEPLRSHSDKNRHQHAAFLREYGQPHQAKKLDRVLQFFQRLPLWLDLGEIRVVHAAWDHQLIATGTPLLSDELLVEAHRTDSPTHRLVETLLKGIEMRLPDGHAFRDKDNHLRHHVRIRWWEDRPQRLRDIALLPASLREQLPDNVPFSWNHGYSATEPPIFFGHYWWLGKARPLASNVACIDYSLARGGALVAYRWDGEQVLQQEHFVSVQALSTR